MPPLTTLLRMTRPGFLLITVIACLLGFASAEACKGAYDWGLALATLVMAVTAHAGANVLNDYHDALNGADAANTRGLFPYTGGSRLIQQGQVSVQQTRKLACWLLGLLVPAGLLLVLKTGSGLLWIGLAGLLLAWAYSAPPLRLMSRGLGELAVALAWWLLVIGADYVQGHQFSLLPAVAALGLAWLVANILLANGYPDAEADRSVGKRTLVVRLGPKRSAWCYLGLALLAHGGLALAVYRLIVPLPGLWGLISLPLSLAAAWQLWRHGKRPEQLRPAIRLTIAAASLHGLGLAAGLAAVG